VGDARRSDPRADVEDRLVVDRTGLRSPGNREYQYPESSIRRPSIQHESNWKIDVNRFPEVARRKMKK
jgi:hypothetical protein